jgi:hypothetical protein
VRCSAQNPSPTIYPSKLDTRFTCVIWTVVCVRYSVALYYSVLLFFFCVLYCSLFVYCTVSACDVLYVLLRFSRAFSSVVRQMTGYNSQRLDTTGTSQISFNFFIVMSVPFSVSCVLFVCNCVLYCCHRVSIQLQLNIEGAYKTMVWFQKLTRNFSPYTGKMYTISSGNCPRF